MRGRIGKRKIYGRAVRAAYLKRAAAFQTPYGYVGKVIVVSGPAQIPSKRSRARFRHVHISPDFKGCHAERKQNIVAPIRICIFAFKRHVPLDFKRRRHVVFGRHDEFDSVLPDISLVNFRFCGGICDIQISVNGYGNIFVKSYSIFRHPPVCQTLQRYIEISAYLKFLVRNQVQYPIICAVVQIYDNIVDIPIIGVVAKQHGLIGSQRILRNQIQIVGG